MTTGFEGPVAGVVLAPAKGFFDALLGPKIEGIRRWAKERELQRQLSADKLEVVFRNYLERALFETSYIRSVAFPQVKIPLSQVYEPLLLENDAGQVMSIIDLKRSMRDFNIIDNAGMGKTTFAKNLFYEMAVNSDYVPILCSLRNYQKEVSFVDYTRAHLDEFDSYFDPEVYVRLIRSGKFFFIFDGFDEIVPDFQASVRSALEEFSSRSADCAILITSRPQENLPALTFNDTLRICPLTIDQAKSLLQRYDRVADSDVGSRLIEQLHLVPKELLASPLLVSLLYRTFGVGNSIAPRITGFYSDVYEALYKGHDLTKAGFFREKISELDIDEFRRTLQGFSFYCLVAGIIYWPSQDALVETIEKSLSLVSSKVQPRKFAADLILAVPFLIWEGNELRFVHRTFCEFFSAEFIVRSLHAESLLTQTQANDHWRTFAQTWEYVAELSPALGRRVFAVPLAEELLSKYGDKLLTPLEVCKESMRFIVSRKFDRTLFVKCSQDIEVFLTLILNLANQTPPIKAVRYSQSRAAEKRSGT
jgi:hypothetical protein